MHAAAAPRTRLMAYSFADSVLLLLTPAASAISGESSDLLLTMMVFTSPPRAPAAATTPANPTSIHGDIDSSLLAQGLAVRSCSFSQASSSSGERTAPSYVLHALSCLSVTTAPFRSAL